MSVIGCKDCATREAKLIAQEARFQKASTDFQAVADRLRGESAQLRRVVDQQRAQLREAENANLREALAAVDGRDDEMNALKTEAEGLRAELAKVKDELERLKGKPAEQGVDPNDPEGTGARLANLEID